MMVWREVRYSVIASQIFCEANKGDLVRKGDLIMDFQELLKNRRAIRDFQDRQVPLSVVKEIIQDSCLAPTASDRQPCKFIIIEDRDFIKKLSDESKRNLLLDLDRNPDSPLRMYEQILREEQFNVFYNAPCLVFVIGPKEVQSLDVDCALTVAYFMFSATSRGLGTCWIALGSNLRERKTLKEMGVPEDCRIVAPVILGYPTGIPEATFRHDPDIIRIIS